MSLVGLIHSTRLVINPLHTVVASRCPDVEFDHIMDEGILRKLTEAKGITPEIIQWLSEIVMSAERNGADLAVVTCSSLSPCVNEVQRQVNIPVLKIDEPMVEHAVQNAERIGLVMTNPTTEAPSTLLFQEVSKKIDKKVRLVPRLCPTAFSQLNHGNIKGHDADVVKTLENLLTETDVVMLAQISIARVREHLDDSIKNRVLSSLDFIAPKIKSILQQT